MSEEADTGGPPVAQLRVSHPASNAMGRGLKLWLDGEELSSLVPGKALAVEIAPGAHALRVSNTYHSKTVEFDAKAGEQVHYRIDNKAGAVSWFLLTVLGSGPMRLQIERAEPVESAAMPLRPRARP
ncbi:MAG TPA: hypothetical protein VF525_03025 [Pyrinomonadaceae bacterium]